MLPKMDWLTLNLVYLVYRTFYVIVTITLVIASDDTAIQIPNSCQYPDTVTRDIQNNNVLIVIKTDPYKWENRTFGYPYGKSKECGIQYNFENPLESDIPKSKKLVLDVHWSQNDTVQECLIKAQFALDSKGVPVKNVSCLKKSMEFLWPAPRFYVEFTRIANYLSDRLCSENNSCADEIHVTLSLLPCNKSCIYAIDEKQQYLYQYFRRLKTVNEFNKDCGMIGCLDKESVGYRVYLGKRTLISESKSCSVKFEIRTKEVCIRRFITHSIGMKTDLTSVNMKIDGKKYMEIKPGDIDVWWCLPWDLRGTMLEFSWDYKDFTFQLDEMELTSKSDKNGFWNCKSKYVTTTRSYFWSSWSSWSSESWSSWSSNYDSSSSESDDGEFPWLTVILITIVIGLGGCMVCGMVAKQRSKKRSQRENLQPAMGIPSQIPLTDVQLPQPQPYPMPPSIPLLSTENTSLVPQTSAFEPDRAPSDMIDNHRNVDETAPPPSYEDVMKGNYIRP